MITENLPEQNLFKEINQPVDVWIEVILPLAIPKTYTYSVPPALNNKIQVGCRAEVVFGMKNSFVLGMFFVQIYEEKRGEFRKTILSATFPYYQ